MSAIISFFETLGNAIIAFIDFIIDIFRDLIWLIEMLAELSPAAPSFLTFLPAGFAYLLTLTLSIVVILRILGRSD